MTRRRREILSIIGNKPRAVHPTPSTLKGVGPIDILKQHMDIYSKDPTYLVLLATMRILLKKQTQSMFAMHWKIDVDLLAERDKDFSSSFIRMLSSFGIFQGEEIEDDDNLCSREDNGRMKTIFLTWECRSDFSNSFLERVRKIMKSQASSQLEQKLIKRGKVHETVFPNTTRQRTNIHGEEENMSASLFNRLILCCP